MRILVTGAAGLIGDAAARYFQSAHQVFALTHRELDITHPEKVTRMVADLRPALIVNGAAIDVDRCEREPERAVAINIRGPAALARAASAVNAELIHFGTNYTFGGRPIGRPPYTIDDRPDPVNEYGRTKVAGERAVRQYCARSYIVRTSWVYGPSKRVFLCTVHEDLRAGHRVRAIHDLWSSTTYVVDLVRRLEQIAAIGHYGIYHVVNGGLCSYYEFAMEAGRLAGLAPPQLDRLVEAVSERDLGRPASRPRYTPLRCLLSERLGLPPLRHWREALAAYVGSG